MGGKDEGCSSPLPPPQEYVFHRRGILRNGKAVLQLKLTVRRCVGEVPSMLLNSPPQISLQHEAVDRELEPRMQTIRRVSLKDRAVQSIREAIERGELEAGQVLTEL